MTPVAVVLAAGKSTRMRSRLPKAAHPIAGRPLLAHVLIAAGAALGPDSAVSPQEGASADAEDHSTRLVVVLGHEAAQVQQALDATSGLPAFGVAYQPAQLGTGDAVRAARAVCAPADPGPEGPGNGSDRKRSVGRSRPSRTPTIGGRDAPSIVLVLYGDSPLVRAETLRALLDTHERERATLTFLTGQAGGPTGYGRVIRDAAGRVQGIVEERHATPEQLRIPEVNSGIYCFQADWLWSRLDQLEPHQPSGEYYLTDLVDLAAREGQPIATLGAPLSETAGVNDRVELAAAAAILRHRILDDLMRSGVTIVDPASTFVDAGVRVGQDTTIQPYTTLQGNTVIGENCVIGPHSVIRDSAIGDDCVVLGSWLEEAVMEAGARIGPMSHLRPGAHLAPGAHLGNFGEVKNSTIGEDVQMHHFSYVGDASIGAGSNVGAGVITVNYDGEKKQHTEVGEGVFLGCDTLLIAPVTVGDDAFTGAGAVVKGDLPPGSLAVGMPARVIRQREPTARTRRKHEPFPTSGTASAGNGETWHDDPADVQGTTGGAK